MTKPVAFIHPEARIGANVVVEPFAYIDKDVEIGDNSWIGPNACIWEGARIGKECKIFPGAQVSAIPRTLSMKVKKPIPSSETTHRSGSLSPFPEERKNEGKLPSAPIAC